jgi:hypothetical protein
MNKLLLSAFSSEDSESDLPTFSSDDGSVDISFQDLLRRKQVREITKKTDLLRQQQEDYPDGKFPWGGWDYSSSEQDSDPKSTTEGNLTDEEGTKIHIPCSALYWVRQAHTRLYIYRNDGQYMVYLREPKWTHCHLSFPVVKRKRAVGVVQVQNSDSD